MQAGDVRQALALRGARIVEQGCGGSERDFEFVGAEAGEVARAEVLRQHAARGFGVELPVG